MVFGFQVKHLNMACHQKRVLSQKTTYESGDVYEGGWSKDGSKVGNGKLIFADGTVYEGSFLAGLFSDQGTLTYPDKSKYEGEFLKGKFNGFGTFTRADGMQFVGCFEEGKVLGNGLITFPDGENGRPRCEGYFEGSRLIRQELSVDVIRKARQITAEIRRERVKTKSAR